MAGGSNIDSKKSTSKARRWVLRSPGRTPTTKARDQAKAPANRTLTWPPHGPSGSSGQQEEQPPAQQQGTSPLNGSSHDSHQKTGAPRADECLAAEDASETSARRFGPPAGTLQIRSRSPLSRIRSKMPVPSAGLMKRFRRKSPNVDGGSRETTEAHDERRSLKGRTTASCSIDITNQETELARHSGGGGETTAGDALTSPVEDDGSVGGLLREPHTAAPDETQSSHSHRRQQRHASPVAGCRGNGMLLKEGVHQEPVIEREGSRAHTTLGVREDAIPAIKTGQQPPRVAFIGVFLNGVAVALASYAPFGGVDARIALIKSVRTIFLARKKQQYVCTPRSTVEQFFSSATSSTSTKDGRSGNPSL